MKCAACGYEYIRQTQTVDDVIRYKSGKRKGDIKTIDTKEIEFKVGHSQFIRLFFKKDVDELGFDDGEYWDNFRQRDLYACPECGTVRIEI